MSQTARPSLTSRQNTEVSSYLAAETEMMIVKKPDVADKGKSAAYTEVPSKHTNALHVTTANTLTLTLSVEA